MSLWNESLNTFAASWLETLIRACWQGGLALGLVWGVCRLAPRIPAAGKCWLWRLAYLKLLVALLWLPTLDLPLLPPADAAPAANFLALTPEVTAPAAVAPKSASIAVAPDSLGTAAPLAAVAPAAAPTVAGWLLLLWIGCLLRQGGQAIRQCLTVRRLRLSGKPLDGGQLDFWNLSLSRDLNLTHVPQLLSSTATDTPLLIGMVRPCIVLPESLLSTCTAEELRLVLAHELAHVQRRDLLWGWLPLLARLVCGFHPLVLLAEREIGMAQEIACDETALHLTGAASAAYGSLLVRVAARFTSRPSQGFGMIGMTESYHTLKRRLSAMKSFPSAPRRYRVAIRFSLLTLGLAALMPWRVSAQATPPVPTTPPATTPPVPTTPPAATPPVPVPPTTPTTPQALPPTPATPAAPTAPPVPTTPAAPARARTTPLTAPSALPPTPAAPPTAAPAALLPVPTAPPSATPQATPTPSGVGVPPVPALPTTPPTVPATPAPTVRRGQGKSLKPAAPAATPVPALPAQAEKPITPPTAGSPDVLSPKNAPRADRGVRLQDPFVDTVPAPQGYPMAAPGMVNSPKPATAPKGRTVDPLQAPTDTPKGMPADPTALPPKPKNAPAEGQAASGSSGIPFLSELPIVGQLFRTVPVHAPVPTLPAPKDVTPPVPSRGIPFLSDLPILGRLFRMNPPK